MHTPKSLGKTRQQARGGHGGRKANGGPGTRVPSGGLRAGGQGCTLADAAPMPGLPVRLCVFARPPPADPVRSHGRRSGSACPMQGGGYTGAL